MSVEEPRFGFGRRKLTISCAVDASLLPLLAVASGNHEYGSKESQGALRTYILYAEPRSISCALGRRGLASLTAGLGDRRIIELSIV